MPLRRHALAALPLVLLSSCADDAAEAPPEPPRFGRASVAELVAAMTLDEKVEQMAGASIATVNDLYLTPANERLDIPGFRMVDGPRGVRAGKATAFPVPAARGATWDPELEREVGRAIGWEANARGATVLLAPTINLLRHPAWGRAQETYGEDTTLLGAMGTAFVQGAQENVLACAKHFAANSIEDTRMEVDVTIDERTLREVYLPHFKRVVQDGRVACVMSAYNKVNGAYASENAHLLRDVLKTEWAFPGFVISDWVFGTHNTVQAAQAGLDIEMPFANHYGPALADAVRAGEVPEAVVDDAVTRILSGQMEGSAKPMAHPGDVESAAHRELARTVAARSMVLLENDGALPLDPASAGKIAVVGSLAAVARLGDEGSSAVTPTTAVTPLDGIAARAGASRTVHVPGPTLTAADEALLASVEAAVVVVGLGPEDEGEAIGMNGGDRDSLRLSAEDEALIADVAAIAPRTVVVLEAGSAIVVRPWVDGVNALVMAWYPGSEGGHAMADVLFGVTEPGGRLPVSFPRDEADLPAFDHTSPAVTYGFLHGYRHLDASGAEPEYPFGFGLSYTTFTLTNLQVSGFSPADRDIIVTVDVTNTGTRAGAEVVQAYVHPAASAVQRAPRDLRGFTRVELAPGETATVTLPIPAPSLAYFEVATGELVIEPGTYVIEVGSSSRDLPLTATVDVGG